MSIFINSAGTRVDINKPMEHDGIRYANLHDEYHRSIIGITEISEPGFPSDYDDRFYTKTELDVEPYVKYTKKSEEEIVAIKIEILKKEINDLEREQLLPRIIREFTLMSVRLQAEAAGLDPMENVAYRKLKEFDDMITILRTQMDALGA